MNELTDFQEITAMALEIDDKQAQKVQRAWPNTQRDLRKALREWKVVTGSSVRGADLLNICEVIWRQRPNDLSETLGRKVLYHPISGLPIEEKSAFYGLSVETLAFLHWSNKCGHLTWSDEIAIVREVQEVDGLIDDLPTDRFWAKNILPRDASGQIDWRDVELAKAREFILKGEATIHFEQMPSHQLQITEDSLMGVLASIPALQNADTRNMLLRGLPPAPVGLIRRSSAPGMDIANIVTAVEGFGVLTNGKMGINVLIDNALRLVKGTKQARLLEKFRL